MYVSCERSLSFRGKENFSCLCPSCQNGYWGVAGRCFCRISIDGTVEQTPLCRCLDKMTYCSETQTYWGISRRSPDNVFVLDGTLREIDCLGVRAAGVTAMMLDDIWYDGERQVLWLVTGQRIYRFNRNGERLGEFLGAPHGTEYRGVCTLGASVFVAAVKHSCLWLYSYTTDGILLDQVSLGGGYGACNLYPVSRQENPQICVFTTRDYRFPVCLDVVLAHGPKCDCRADQSHRSLVSVECVSEAHELHMTCAVRENESMECYHKS